MAELDFYTKLNAVLNVIHIVLQAAMVWLLFAGFRVLLALKRNSERRP